MVQATFYVMLLNNVVGLGIVSGFIAVDLKASLAGLRWMSFESWMFVNKRYILEVAEYVRDTFCWSLRESSALRLNPLPEDYHGLCPGFDLGVATRYPHYSNIPKMVQAIFYAMDRHKLHNVYPTSPKLDHHGALAVGNEAKALEGSDPPSCEPTREPGGIEQPSGGFGFKRCSPHIQ
ncbi:hypothetical protein Cgig2_033626 [Carnegiea gigantea]|uniref:Uncharacterized protein n=1 Tax=Carnegiea gigantea TaxID=171969 RepID=A0A9Q1K0W3_9CARY|nr:hypothetical protein Cgig2_033626 [Carnegiea gigantea]